MKYNKLMKKTFKILFITLLILTIYNYQEAQAYINPGSGSYIFQTIIGGVLGFFYLIKKCFLSIFNIFSKRNRKSEKELGEHLENE